MFGNVLSANSILQLWLGLGGWFPQGLEYRFLESFFGGDV